MSKNLNGGGLTQRLLLAVIAAGVVIIAGILVYETWNKRRAAREAAAALQELEKNRPKRYVATTLAEGAPASHEQITVSVDQEGALRLSSGAGDPEAVEDADQLRARLEQLIRERRGHGLDRTALGAMILSTFDGFREEACPQHLALAL
ncbi:MAG TPA: hypothetical protein VF179_02035 [Thermoanaerobaculia bacterium]|nr:hypothetical protein [Thermoanaerobaculia bacterium]